MGIRQGEHIHLTIACALVDRFVLNLTDYLDAKGKIAAIAVQTAKENGAAKVSVDVNTADNPAAGSIYFTVTGTSAEAGDDGEAGRGNRVNGLIAPFRPMTMESVDVAQLVARNAIGAGIEGVKLGAEICAAVLVPGEGLSLVAEIAREGRHGMASVGEFKDASADKHEVIRREGGRRWHRKLGRQGKFHAARAAGVVRAAKAEPEKFGALKEDMDASGKVDRAFKMKRAPIVAPMSAISLQWPKLAKSFRASSPIRVGSSESIPAKASSAAPSAITILHCLRRLRPYQSAACCQRLRALSLDEPDTPSPELT